MMKKFTVTPFVLLIFSLCIYSQSFAITLREYASRPRVMVETSYNDGILSMQKGDLVGAEKAFRAGLNIEPDFVPSILGLIEALIKQNRIVEADELLERVLILEPGNSEVQRVWGRYLSITERFDEAEAAFKKSIELNPNAFRSLVSLGNLYLIEMGRAGDAVDIYRTALTIQPEHVGLHYSLGNALIAAGNLKEAKVELQEAGRLAPDNPLPFYTLGQLYIVNDESDMALDAFGKALDAQPLFFQAHMERGDLYFLKGEDEKAFHEYKSALKIEPQFAMAQVKIGMIYESNKRISEAESAYLAALDIDPNQVIAYNNLAWMAAEQGTNLDNALTWAKKANEIVFHPEFKDTLGWVYRARGELDKAMTVLEEASSIEPRKASILYHLGVIYSERGMVKEAVETLKGALLIDENFSHTDDIRQLLEQLYEIH
jgi:tetratricopeptide (TPR) repeat protein